MRRSRALLSVAAVAAICLLAGCGESTESRDGGPRVVATTTPLADIARAVAGDRASVSGLLGAGVDPHDYEPTPSDVRAVAEADLVIESGAGLDSWIARVVTSADTAPARLDGSSVIPLDDPDEGPREGDPHYWLDPDNGQRLAAAIGEALATADPDDGEAYRRAAADYAGRIATLDAELTATIATVPPERRLLVTSHDAFGYAARHYGIRVVGAALPSLSTSAEPDAKALTELTATIRRSGVTTIFAEDSVDPRLERAIARASGARVGPALFADSLGPTDGPAGTYLGMLRTNVERIVAGLAA